MTVLVLELASNETRAAGTYLEKTQIYVHVWASATKPAELRIYYADNNTGQNEMYEHYALQSDKLSNIISIRKKPYVRVDVVNGSSQQTVNVEIVYDNVSNGQALNIQANDIGMNLNYTLKNLTTERPPITNESSVQIYSRNDNNDKPILTDDAGRFIVSTNNSSPLSVTGSASVTGPVSITGPISATGTVNISGIIAVKSSETEPVKCNINPNQYISISGTTNVQGSSTINIPADQYIGISGPITVKPDAVNCHVPNVTLRNGTPSVSGYVSCAISSGQLVGITGPAYNILQGLSTQLTNLIPKIAITSTGSRGNLISNITIGSGANLANSLSSFGIDSILCYSDVNPTATGNIEILGTRSGIAASIGIITPIIKYSISGLPIGRWGSIKLNAAPIIIFYIKNLSSIPVTVTCSLYSGKPLAVP